jgi:hypothetical protein
LVNVYSRNGRCFPGRIGRGWTGVVLAAVCLAAAGARGQIIKPLYLSNLTPVLDQNGNPMPGMYYDDPANRARVEIRIAPNHLRYPPSPTGAAHPNNPLLTADSVGGIGMNTAEPGLFAMVFSQRPAADTVIFARVFNTPALADASFYADSRTVTVTANAVSLEMYFLDETQPLDSGDSDGDGLINSWEKALGIDDRATPDYDGDGFTDLHEHLMGSDPTDSASIPAIQSIARVPAGSVESGGDGDAMRVRFLSQPGQKYQLEQAAILAGEQVFEPAGDVVTAGAGQREMDALAPVAAEAATTFYRIRWIP